MKLQDVLITGELKSRKSRRPDVFGERRGFTTIARRTTYGRAAILQTICEQALVLCNADSTGVSLLCESDGEEAFSWDALAGRFAPFVGGKAPRHESPCGVCLELGATQLFSHPERYFAWLRETDVPITEGLVVPMYQEDKIPLGTIWIVLHDERRVFDAEDARIMTALAGHTSAALRMAIHD
ncbi:GAF domain-containing protein [Noviherbaspirillum sp. Root189]|uniref:GAF domain-containing protein n=1 Tax=Noviherbaspirillum sp. Root189 TaxID=1736487 RepID=UPI00070A7F28|nr:GAF domain-containing protein [Noviherbaspirillum sp. Root189]KRB67800.1 hypothetical protein ASE07_09005 [Noviherbaspirillum sp. Root189]